MNATKLTVLIALGVVRAELKNDVDCHEAVEADTDNEVYEAEAELEACGEAVTATTCADAAAAFDASDSAGKQACVMLHQGCDDNDASAHCTFHQQVAAAGEQGDDWDPRTCENDHPDDYAGLITWGADANAWNDPYDCADDTASGEDAANTVSAGLATLAMALFITM
tara:strand:+ start:159 stop:662 length:504 start_codon:yes stop_codon:yes gene_type:complete